MLTIDQYQTWLERQLDSTFVWPSCADFVAFTRFYASTDSSSPELPVWFQHLAQRRNTQGAAAFTFPQALALLAEVRAEMED